MLSFLLGSCFVYQSLHVVVIASQEQDTTQPMELEESFLILFSAFSSRFAKKRYKPSFL
ncbi:unnamed protein product [Brassica napus]|uniref:(rape) hypothetical protein n=1 Tax=Brassica napus TaxID=3708 RepID=A0A816I9K1_BRANA|nr:unnamed protein product [Brassica napus]